MVSFEIPSMKILISVKFTSFTSLNSLNSRMVSELFLWPDVPIQKSNCNVDIMSPGAAMALSQYEVRVQTADQKRQSRVKCNSTMLLYQEKKCRTLCNCARNVGACCVLHLHYCQGACVIQYVHAADSSEGTSLRLAAAVSDVLFDWHILWAFSWRASDRKKTISFTVLYVESW